MSRSVRRIPWASPALWLPAGLLLAAMLACDISAINPPPPPSVTAGAGIAATREALAAQATSLAQTAEVVAQATATTLPTEPAATVTPSPTAQAEAPTGTPTPAPAPGSDPFEPDDTPEQASVIATNGNPQAHTFGKASDEDWIAFDGVKGTRYTIKTFDLGAEADTFIELFDSGGNSLGYDDDGTGTIFGPSVLIFNCGSDARFYVKVRNFFHGNVGTQANYSFAVTAR